MAGGKFPPLNFGCENCPKIFFLSKNAKFGDENPILGKFAGKIETEHS